MERLEIELPSDLLREIDAGCQYHDRSYEIRRLLRLALHPETLPACDRCGRPWSSRVQLASGGAYGNVCRERSR